VKVIPGSRLFLLKRITALAVVIVAVLGIEAGCSRDNSVREYFQTHGLEYPSDVSGISLLGIQYSGIEREEMQQPGAREFVEEGIVFSKIYLHKENVDAIIPGCEAIIASKPVLFRDGEGDVGLMVRITAYGTDAAFDWKGLRTEWMGKDRKLWKVENFAYFNRNDFYRWQFGGWVY
jgi:hypothetical protein